MSDINKIAEEHRKMFEHLKGATSHSGVVKGLDEANNVASVQLTDNEGTIHVDAILNATVDNSLGFIIIPALDSDVVVVDVDGDGVYTIVRYGKIDRVKVKIGDTEELIVTEGTVIFNGGSNGGMVKVAALVEKVNALENDINTLKTVFSGWTVAPTDGGGALKLAAATWFASNLTPTTANDLKNDNVKH